MKQGHFTGWRSVAATVATLTMLSMAIPYPAEAGRKDREACADVKAKIREIQDRMRAGYSHSQGVRYEARLKQLREKRRRVCR